MVWHAHARAQDTLGQELTTTLFSAALPNAVMMGVFLMLGSHIALVLGDGVILAALTAGSCASLTKIVLILAFRRRASPHGPGWSRTFVGASIVFALSLGVLILRTFASDAILLQMLATGLLFGYCAGLVAHTSVKPWLAVACLSITSVPAAFAAAMKPDVPHQLFATSVACFLLASFHSVQQMFRVTCDQIRMRQSMAVLASVDPLTKLPNRLSLGEAYRHKATGGDVVALHCLDLDAFKPVNDRFGHPVGDGVLKAVGDRLRGVIREGDTAARVGGDEFIVIQAAVKGHEDAEAFARRLIESVRAPYEIGGHAIAIGASVGFAIAHAGAEPLERVVAHADEALYRAKQDGRGIAAAMAEAL